jgi:hypothetical protein
MPKPPAADVAAFLAACRHPLRAELDALRGVVQRAAPQLVEGIKWNAPSWGWPGGADDCMTANLGNKAVVRLVLHRGAQKGASADAAPFVDFDAPWLQWPAPDRAVATFASMAELDAARPALTQLIKAWALASRTVEAPAAAPKKAPAKPATAPPPRRPS